MKPSSLMEKVLSIAGSSMSDFSTMAQCQRSFQTVRGRRASANIFYRQITRL